MENILIFLPVILVILCIGVFHSEIFQYLKIRKYKKRYKNLRNYMYLRSISYWKCKNSGCDNKDLIATDYIQMGLEENLKCPKCKSRLSFSHEMFITTEHEHQYY